MALIRFQCPECGMDREVGHLVEETEVYCVVCWEEQIRVQRWEEVEGSQARLRAGLVSA
jgi:hypothetical protein